ncbi:hypothetical protein EDI_244220 [Entamoeba dispar SAW760]|uniref:Uncharacterized protein n=1 Tax=Entamoeba dispar (strain ATCC PRA-260 / SAW760) TaxID=370354 RepID=B0EAY3_ENTDS|nr:uncharacterized protein EDI_244220 [Entamoeba dispar SAW760]EDR28290.1 hypothetical protein EDI_244220 [Entamoeba dispar SAW760]|eukprot:EDR28290.1 hypothetical protein EDI_244220 [Entamoeba dispar SAW760]
MKKSKTINITGDKEILDILGFRPPHHIDLTEFQPKIQITQDLNSNILHLLAGVRTSKIDKSEIKKGCTSETPLFAHSEKEFKNPQEEKEVNENTNLISKEIVPSDYSLIDISCIPKEPSQALSVLKPNKKKVKERNGTTKLEIGMHTAIMPSYLNHITNNKRTKTKPLMIGVQQLLKKPPTPTKKRITETTHIQTMNRLEKRKSLEIKHNTNEQIKRTEHVLKETHKTIADTQSLIKKIERQTTATNDIKEFKERNAANRAIKLRAEKVIREIDRKRKSLINKTEIETRAKRMTLPQLPNYLKQAIKKKKTEAIKSKSL